MDLSLRSERRSRWQSDSDFERDSVKFKVARIIRKIFTSRLLLLLLFVNIGLWVLHASWVFQSPLLLLSGLVSLRLVIVRFNRRRPQRFIQLVDHQNTLGKQQPAESQAEKSV